MPEDLTENCPQMGVPAYLCGPAMAAICVECIDGGIVENGVNEYCYTRPLKMPCGIIRRKAFPGSAIGRGRVGPRAENKLFSISCFLSSEGAVVNYAL